LRYTPTATYFLSERHNATPHQRALGHDVHPKAVNKRILNKVNAMQIWRSLSALT
jgi:hypothetical protein